MGTTTESRGAEGGRKIRNRLQSMGKHVRPIGVSALWLGWEWWYYWRSAKGLCGQTPYMCPFWLFVVSLAFFGWSAGLFWRHRRKHGRAHWGFAAAACLLAVAVWVAWRFMAELGSVT